MDLYSFASLGHIRVLLIPIGSIRPHSFDEHVQDIKACHQIRFSDIPADGNGEKGM
jgi:hypothetical protein